MMSESGNGAARNPANVRYHGLDALRAWAMSMGIVLHAAWFMIPGDAGAPMTDGSASSVTDFICLAIHTFRMQLFFVLAGLFACLLLRKRGLRQFALNRTQRIFLPLAIFWLILCPIMIWQYNAGGILSGAIQGDKSAWQLTVEYFANLTAENVMFVHLWFLYYLGLTYVLVMMARGLAGIVDSRRTCRQWISDRFAELVVKPWSVLVLAALFGALMIPMKGPWGVEIALSGLYPKWPGLLTYICYFLVGWLIFRNIDKLSLIVRGWRWQLVLGVLLIFPYFFYARYVQHHGYATWNYPLLAEADFRSEDGNSAYADFRSNLMESDPATVAGTLWQAIPEENRTFVEQHEAASSNQFNGLLTAINLKVLSDAEFAGNFVLEPMELSEASRTIIDIPESERTAAQTQLLNREILNRGFERLLYSEDVNRPYYYPIRVAYSFTYSLITWLLIFGCIGFSQNYFDSESRFWRYFSDSSYWFYLAHLPIQFQLLLWVGDEPWHWALKFTFYIVVTTALLWPSYHLLVRPTRIGWFLNGRMVSVWQRSQDHTEMKSQDASGTSSGDVSGPQRTTNPSDRQINRLDKRTSRMNGHRVEAKNPADEKVS